MALTDRSTVILVAILGVVGTLGAAVISNPSILESQERDSAEAIGFDQEHSAAPITPTPSVAATARGLTAPHAPEILLSQSTKTWGENTKVLTIEPGKEASFEGLAVFPQVTAFPQGTCAGPEYIAYTWQVRDPYPEGGDLEIKELYRQTGGTRRDALGAMGSGQMGPCDIRLFKNNGLQPITVEVRYAGAMDEQFDPSEMAPAAVQE